MPKRDGNGNTFGSAIPKSSYTPDYLTLASGLWSAPCSVRQARHETLNCGLWRRRCYAPEQCTRQIDASEPGTVSADAAGCRVLKWHEAGPAFWF